MCLRLDGGLAPGTPPRVIDLRANHFKPLTLIIQLIGQPLRQHGPIHEPKDSLAILTFLNANEFTCDQQADHHSKFCPKYIALKPANGGAHDSAHYWDWQLIKCNAQVNSQDFCKVFFFF